VETARHRAVQVLRYRLAMLGRRLHQQGIDRAQGLLMRRIGRAQQRIDEQTYRLKELARAAIDGPQRTLRGLEGRLARFDMRPRLAADRRRVEAAHAMAVQLARARVARDRGRLERLSVQLEQLSPLKILERGYAIVSNELGIVKDAAAAPVGSDVHLRLGRGELNAKVIVKGS
jgi:exodeoxyribonuclease VII large subunit